MRMRDVDMVVDRTVYVVVFSDEEHVFPSETAARAFLNEERPKRSDGFVLKRVHYRYKGF